LNKPRPYILHLPQWFPSSEDTQFGIFTQKHIRSASPYFGNVVIYILGVDHGILEPNPEMTNDDDISAFTVRYRKAGKKGLAGQLINARRYYRSFRKAWKMVKEAHGLPALVNAHVLLKPALLALLLRYRYRIPYVITEHWTGYASGMYEGKSAIFRYLCRLSLRRASGLAVVSEHLRESMKAQHLSHPTTVVIPNVIDHFPELMPPQKKSKAFILTVADLADKNKNISGSLQALQVLKEQGFDFEFHIIGGGRDEQKLKNLCNTLGLDGHVTFHGRQSNHYVLNFMPNVDFVLVNSRVETFSVVTAEALACGKPVIATKSGGPEVFVNNDCGLVVDIDDEEALHYALEDMIQHFAVYKPHRMQEHIHKLFNEERIGISWKGFYELSLNHKG
jgi:glycosyltransferase involved in cell wall biosynthesis